MKYSFYEDNETLIEQNECNEIFCISVRGDEIVAEVHGEQVLTPKQTAVALAIGITTILKFIAKDDAEVVMLKHILTEGLEKRL